MFKIKSCYINPNGKCSMAYKASNLYRIYKNSNAKDLFMKAQKAETVEERTKLFEQMGEYKLVTEVPKKQIGGLFMQLLKGLFNVH